MTVLKFLGWVVLYLLCVPALALLCIIVIYTAVAMAAEFQS